MKNEKSTTKYLLCAVAGTTTAVREDGVMVDPCDIMHMPIAQVDELRARIGDYMEVCDDGSWVLSHVSL